MQEIASVPVQEVSVGLTVKVSALCEVYKIHVLSLILCIYESLQRYRCTKLGVVNHSSLCMY